MSKNCLYALGGINYKNGVISTCPRQADQLVYAHETILPSKIFNHKNFRDMRKLLHEDQWPQGCSTCEEMEKSDLKSMRFDYVLDTDNYFCKNKVGDDREIASKKLLDCYDNTDHSVNLDLVQHVIFHACIVRKYIHRVGQKN